MFEGQSIIPAIKSAKSLEMFCKSDKKYGVFLETHIGQISAWITLSKKYNKQVLVHHDLIQGLTSDDAAVEFVCQKLKPYGIISTKPSVINKAKQQKCKTILRIFLLDSVALTKAIKQIHYCQPDAVEILPGLMPDMMALIHEQTNIPIIAGGLITKNCHMEQALASGVMCVTTSHHELW